jgi:hypothetical protein
MTLNFNAGALIGGVVLLLAALLAGVLFRDPARRGAVSATRITLGIAGLALLGWGTLPYLLAPKSPPLAPILAPEALTPLPPTASLPGEPGQAAAAALQDCNRPEPPSIPDASKASKAEMLTARSAFQAYDAATNVYTRCVDAAIEAVIKQFPGASPADLQTVHILGTGAHNTAVDQEQATADQFNTQVRAYKAKHPQG